ASASGLHARPAGIFAQAAAEQPATVTIEKPGGNAVQASSMLMLMTLGAGKGDEVTLRAEGEGAEESVAALAALLEKDLDAEERAARRPRRAPLPATCRADAARPPIPSTSGRYRGSRRACRSSADARGARRGRAGSPARSRGEPGGSEPQFAEARQTGADRADRVARGAGRERLRRELLGLRRRHGGQHLRQERKS